MPVMAAISRGKTLARGAAGAGLLAVGSFGCHTPPPYTPPPEPAFMREDLKLAVPPPDDRNQSPVTTRDAAGQVAVPVPPAVGPPDPRPVEVTLPEAVTEVIHHNLRVKAGAEKVQQARADLTTSSLIPNPQLLFDSLLNPVPGTRFSRLAPTLSKERRTLRVVFELSDPEGRLRPGLFADVGLGTERREVVTVPAEAVLHIGRADYVLVETKGGEYRVTEVRVGEPHGPRLEIRSGLAPEGRVVGGGAILLKPLAVQALLPPPGGPGGGP